jgi:galactosamine-6-phosphate isomerase
MSRRAERIIVAELRRTPSLLFCASAGGTPTLLYELLAARYHDEPNLFKRMRVLQIDEWGGLPKRHPASCETDLRIKLLDPLGIGKDRYVGFRTEARNPQSDCGRIEKWLGANGPIDICILGLGLNGHIAINEPGESLSPAAHRARLTPSSLQHPMLKDVRRKPRYGLTLGMTAILNSRTAMLLVNGRHKRDAMKRLLSPQITTQFPASFLWLHPRAIVLCDQDSCPVKS